jgi:glutamate N-acetyltransferase/amino-acid N-acetyltransferase
MGNFKISEESAGCVEITGFSASGIHCDIRDKADGRLDLALVLSECPCTVAGVFTRNKMAAAPVRLDRNLLASGDYFKGFVVNSGNANACTGESGMKDALSMQKLVADQVDCIPEEILVASTGRIGEKLPMEKIEKGIASAVASLNDDSESGLNAADAILTSDTCRKVCSATVSTDSGDITISGMAKGAGMIEPNMATMLAFICTDAALGKDGAQELLTEGVESSFNAITVDGDESTNDTVLLFANGSSGVYLDPSNVAYEDFKAALKKVCEILARKIVGDGEKITKVVEVSIQGAASKEDAEKAARTIGNSLLVKSSWYGNDPNWGRVIDALGYSGAETSEEAVQLWYGEEGQNELVQVFSKGEVFTDNKSKWKSIVSNHKFKIVIDLGTGSESSRIWSTDLSEGYVNFNKSE